MKVKVLGIQSVDYVSKKTGERVLGTTLHTSCKDPAVLGDSVSTIFVSDRLQLGDTLRGIAIGSVVDVEYNNRGFVCGLELLPSGK